MFLLKFLKDLRILLYKNFLIKSRNYFQTIGEILLPLQLIFVLWAFSYVFHDTNEVKHYPSVNSILCTQKPCKKIAIFPSENIYAKYYSTKFPKDIVIDLLENENTYLSKYKEYYSAIEFGKYDNMYNGYSIINKTDHSLNQTNNYVDTSFIDLQNIILNTLNSKIKIELNTKQFPLKSSESIFSKFNLFIYPIYFAFSAIGISQAHLISLVNERKKHLKGHLRIMGSSMIAYNISWIIISLFECFLTLIIICIFIFLLRMITITTNYLLFILVNFFYLISMVLISHIFSFFFKEEKTAAISFSFIFSLFIAFWIFSSFIIFPNKSLPIWIQFFFNLIPTIGFSEFILNLIISERHQSNLFLNSNSNYSIPLFLFNILTNWIIYILISFYLEFVYPGSDFIGKSPLFFIYPSFWKSLFINQKEDEINIEQEEQDDDDDDDLSLGLNNNGLSLNNELNEQQDDLNSEQEIELLESPNSEIELVNKDLNGIHLNGITKIFSSDESIFGYCKKNEEIAVDDLCLNIKKGEIFALLGANGAGKSTTFKMICGLLKPTSGSIKINNLDIFENIDLIHSFLGVCSQDDIFFEKLTAKEHLKIFGEIKGIKKNEIEKRILNALNEVGLFEFKDQIVSEFSGGMKRKLSIAIALIGNPKFIILDEPTTGMDPNSRRNIWKILQKLKKKILILLSTHSMEEADILADRIAIMKKGKLEVTGTSLYLKGHYGIGYCLTCYPMVYQLQL
eukprot:gene5091-8690_t